jgi:DNA-binding NarL/FixJ family response regulator
LQAVEAHKPNVLLVDVSLPVFSGFSVTEKVRQQYPDVKVIFITAHADRQYVQRAFESGARGYVVKGSIGKELVAAVRAVVAGDLYRSPSLG